MAAGAHRMVAGSMHTGPVPLAVLAPEDPQGLGSSAVVQGFCTPFEHV